MLVLVIKSFVMSTDPALKLSRIIDLIARNRFELQTSMRRCLLISQSVGRSLGRSEKFVRYLHAKVATSQSNEQALQRFSGNQAYID